MRARLCRRERILEFSMSWNEAARRGIDYNGKLEVHSLLLNVALHDEPRIRT
jgi:hypothetical protein